MHENLSFVDQCNDHVRDYEAYILLRLIADEEYWKQKAVECGCPNCTKSYEAAVERLNDEFARQKLG